MAIAVTVDSTGITAPDYADIFSYFQETYRGIYGQDVYLEPDSQDGQFLAVLAQAVHDCNSAAVTVFNAFSPATAQGEGLSRVVKINGISRQSASYSTVDLLLTGTAGTTISNGVAQDAAGQKWSLPATVTIPSGGTVTATATAQTSGKVAAAAGSITQVATPTAGWTAVTNPAAASPGADVETDAGLRVRQSTSTALPSLTVLEGLIGAVAAVPGVTRYAAYENDTSATDSNGIPSHSISLVVEGGDSHTIGETIAAKKTPGAGTYGTTVAYVYDAYGRPEFIRFYRPTSVGITATVNMKALTGYSSATGALIRQAIADYVNATAIGGAPSGTVEWDGAIAAAKSVSGASTFRITSLTLSRASAAGTPDVPLAFNEAAACTADDVTLMVT